ncbi:MAG: amidohydrolase [Bacteroidota bacterium]|jgi:omega-amidase
MNTLRVSLLQTTLLWEDPNGNRLIIEEQLRPLSKGSSDIIILPEMFTSGFTMNASSVSEKMNGTTVQWMHALAQRKNAVVCGSLVIKSGSRYYNRFVWMPPDGSLAFYDKRHLFRMAGEHNSYAAGKRKKIFEYKGWRICPMVCYDLRFPVWTRNTEGYDLLIYVANWPEKRRLAWNTLLPARAIENQCYVAAVNRVGKDGKGIIYSGDSQIFDPLGDQITKTPTNKGALVTAKLYKNQLEDLRRSFPVSMDADRFSIRGR